MDKYIKPKIAPTAWIAETAVVRGNVTLEEDVSIWFGAVLRGDEAPISVGERSNIQDTAVLHVSAGKPCIIGKDVTVGHAAVVHGCTVHDGALIGMHATVLDGAVIGSGALVGAGAVVPPGMVVPAGMLVLGVPAKVIGPLNAAQAETSKRAVGHYVERKEQYRQGIY